MTQTRAKKASVVALATMTFCVLTQTAWATSCDRACLLEQAKRFNTIMLAHMSSDVKLAPGAAIRENTKTIALTESRWSNVMEILSKSVFTDPVSGNVIEHVAAKTTSGKVVYIGTRLKVIDHKITEVEINFDDSDHVNLKNLVSIRSNF